MSINNPVRTLNPEVARKIAAGEVIDRPNAIIRELMDNAIDSGAKEITVEIWGGGIEKIRIIDDGSGMTKEDLQNCARPHATSKISSELDLLNLSTLGFRGEALASIAAVSRLSIVSGGWKMRASLTEDHIIEPVAEITGTIVQSEGLFENFPARRQFLKRAATEGVMCKNTFIEKAMARPDIAFRFISEGEIKIDLPENQSIKDRFLQANSYSEAPELFFEISNSSGPSHGSQIPDWSFNVVIGEPAVSRSNKKEISIFANGRKIQEYSLVQAVEYGGQGFFPNGTYPVAAVFVEVKPDLIDFNIHPAKKEARFYDISSLHHGLSSTIKSFFQKYTYQNFIEDKPADEPRTSPLINDLDFNSLKPAAPYPASPESSQNSNFPSSSEYSASASGSAYSSPQFTENRWTDTDSKHLYEKHISYKQSETGTQKLSDFRSKYLGIKTHENNPESEIKDFAPEQNPAIEQTSSIKQNPETEQNDKTQVRFIGTCLGTFLLAEKNNSLYIIDQHAVHERILFDRIMNSQANASTQQLLIPYKISTESKTQDNQLEKLKDRLTQIGFTIEKISDGKWEITTIPDRWTGTEYELRNLLFVKQVEPEQVIRAIAAMTACKAAVKDGYILDDVAAARLVEQAFTLPDPHCPHGRPVYTVFSRERLFELVKRT